MQPPRGAVFRRKPEHQQRPAGDRVGVAESENRQPRLRLVGVDQAQPAAPVGDCGQA